MCGYYISVWLFMFAIFARITEVKMETTLKRGLYSRVELIGETLDQQTADSLISVEWTKINKSSRCLCFRKYNNKDLHYSQCCGKAHFYISNNSLILENVTKQDEGLYRETIALKDKPTKHQNFTLIIDCENSTINQENTPSGKRQMVQILFTSGLMFMGVLGLCVVFYCLHKHQHMDADKVYGTNQKAGDPEEMTTLSYVYTDFIKSRVSSQACCEDFSYSKFGPTCSEETIVLYLANNEEIRKNKNRASM